MTLELWGIPNCDQVRKARSYLEAAGVAFHFRDIRKSPPTSSEWQALIEQDHAGTLVNTKSPSFRKTGLSSKELDAAGKLRVLTSQPTAMKRPALIDHSRLLYCGFQSERYAELLGGRRG